MKIYIDFDRTLFDCESFLKKLYEIIKKYEIPKSIFIKCQNQCKKAGFNPHIILEKVANEYQFNIKIYDEINNLINESNSYLYPDAIPLLEHLKRANYEVIILTKGNFDYQKEKIYNSNIKDYYDELIVTMKHKGNLDINYEKSIFIDDNPIEIKSILRRKPKELIRIKRINSKYFNVDIENIKTVSSLDEIIKKNML